MTPEPPVPPEPEGLLPRGRAEPTLFAEMPELVGAVPFCPLVHAPTPVEPASALEPWLGRGGIWHKRDDKISPLYGGNKVRRFEFLLADAARRGASEIVTVGGLASTQVTATIHFGRALGFDVTAALFDQPVTLFARQALLSDVAAGGRLLRGRGYLSTGIETVGALRRAHSPYLILPGASNPTANLGYVDAMFELAAQVERGEMPRPDVVVVPAGSGGTLVGLALGAAILGWETEFVGVRITDLFACNAFTIRLLHEATAALLRHHAPRAMSRRRLPGPRMRLHHGAIGEGYGYPTPEAIAAMPVVEAMTGVAGEVTYSGKGLVGLRAIARARPTSTILYWHTLSSVRPELPPVTPAELGEDFAECFRGDVPV